MALRGRALGLALLLGLGVAQAQQRITLEPSQDASLYETLATEPALANGGGQYLFTGRVKADGNNRQRRALLKFDLAAALPPGATLVAARLQLSLSKIPLSTQFPLGVKLHRLLSPWSEGDSDPPGQEGQGISASAGDVSWWQRHHDDNNPLPWESSPGVPQPGGVFDPIATASTTIGFALETYTWECSTALLAEVQDWLDNPTNNHGWLLLVSENPPAGAARRFDSREAPDPTRRPQLEIFYQHPEVILEAGFEPSYCSENSSTKAVP